MIRLLNKRKLLTFQVQGCLKTKGGIYTTFGGVYDYFDCEPVWLASIGEETQLYKEGAMVGDIGIILDTFEHEEIRGQWDECKHMPEFESLRKKAEEFNGKITASIIHENSLIAWFSPSTVESGQCIEIGRGSTGKFYA